MQNTTQVVGIDPGLVHTGAVRFSFDPAAKLIEIEHEVIAGCDGNAVKAFTWSGVARTSYGPIYQFIEGYRPRSHFNTDKKMAEGIQKIRAVNPRAVVLDNMGVKKVIKRPFMEALGVWSFSTPTHHQDLRSAARIALLGMVKDPELNKLLADTIHDRINGSPWAVVHI